MSDPEASRGAAQLRVLASGTGRALYVDDRGALYVARGGTLWRSDDVGRTWARDCALPWLGRFDPRSWTKLTRRLFRRHFQAMEILGDGTRIVVARDGLYYAAPGSHELRLGFPIVRGSRPLGLARDDRDRVVFGEYGTNPERREVHLYASVDRGRSFEVCHTFPRGSVRHVHGVEFDPDIPGFWVFVGDADHECGIGTLGADLRTFTWAARGKQTVRVVQAIRVGGGLVYGTDSEVSENAIVRFDARSGRIDRLRPVEGSCLFAGSFGGVGLISTCVEPSEVNRSRDAVLYGSSDLAEWAPVLARRKDPWPSLFQFGTFVLARSGSKRPIALLSGQALRGMDETFQAVELSTVSR